MVNLRQIGADLRDRFGYIFNSGIISPIWYCIFTAVELRW